MSPGPAFRRYRDRIRTDSAAFERRRPHMEHIFRRLRRSGIARRGLYRAWDFTVASADGLSGRMRHIRDESFGQLGDTRLDDMRVEGASPPFSVDSVTEFAPCGSDGCQDGEDADIDFDPFAALMYPAYPDELERPLLLSMVQMLWDRGEPNGYAQHMTGDPYPNTPPHTVLLHMAFGDHQVANVATEVQARTIGARIQRPATDPGRHTDRVPYYGIEPIRRYPYSGSALVVWDIGPLRPDGGTAPPPITNTPPRLGRDPHGLTGREPPAQLQFSEFLDGTLIDVCGPSPCYAAGWTGP